MSYLKALAKFPSLLDVYRLPFANLKYLKIKLKRWMSSIEAERPACVLNFFLNSSTNAKLKFYMDNKVAACGTCGMRNHGISGFLKSLMVLLAIANFLVHGALVVYGAN
ncbi:hypothetical protein COLO4_38577 [Corchorus olitorius]|uniref:Uncharacterized protein n=1 Tax=Corchorus olitorius TaxID=93759 RepID=A0A1R3FUA5_9ROSI|nr:hypothetical protein COLO4_38577 [Corchorus olitorius]